MRYVVVPRVAAYSSIRESARTKKETCPRTLTHSRPHARTHMSRQTGRQAGRQAGGWVGGRAGTHIRNVHADFEAAVAAVCDVDGVVEIARGGGVDGAHALPESYNVIHPLSWLTYQ